jgi:cytochrome b561
MGSFSIWHWLIVLVIFGVILWLVARSVRATDAEKHALKGIGGWLGFLALVQILGLLRVVAGFAESVTTYAPIAAIPGAKLAIAAELLINIGLVALTLATTIALFRHKKAFISLFMYQWLAAPIASFTNVVVVSGALGVPQSDLITSDDVVKVFASFLAGGLWVWYTRYSVRVANTMVN